MKHVRFLGASLMLACLSLVLGHRPALAWGSEGHVAIATIASTMISDTTRREVELLLGPGAAAQMATASTWADEIRLFHPETAEWHFINIPLSSPTADMARDCPNGECVVAALDHFADVLHDRSQPLPVRVDALRYVIHFVGDIEQPLHCVNNGDHGGNAVHIRIGGFTGSLHQLWDTELVHLVEDQMKVRGGRALGAKLAENISADQRRLWAAGNPLAWANQSHRVAVAVAYAGIQGTGGNSPGAPLVYDPSYARQALPVVIAQIEMAGVRLAAVLDMLLGGS